MCKALVFLTSLGFVAISTASGASDLGACKAQTPASFAPCQRLAQEGNVAGLFGLGMLYLEGNGVAQNYAKSFQLMLKAAQLGNEYAQFQVGQAYVNGQGAIRNYEEAYAWFLVAKANKNELAQQGIDFLTKNNAVKPSRLNAVTQRANDLFASTKNKKGFKFDPKESQKPVSGITEFCDLTMPTVDTVIQMKKYGKPRTDTQQLMVGMTDTRAISMMNGVIDWVWSVGIPPDQMHDSFKEKCLKQSPEVGFMFQQ
jgi:hypothetical protein